MLSRAINPSWIPNSDKERSRIVRRRRYLGHPSRQRQLPGEVPRPLPRVDPRRLDANRRLILNGDVFDSIDFRRLKKQHWKILSDSCGSSRTRSRSSGSTATTTAPRRSSRTCSACRCRDEIVVESGGRKILFLHGHRFDEFISRYPFITWFADRMYQLLQRIDKSHYFAKLAKRQEQDVPAVRGEDRGRLQFATRNGRAATRSAAATRTTRSRTRPARSTTSTAAAGPRSRATTSTVRDGVVELRRYTEAVPEAVLGVLVRVRSRGH